MDGLYRPALCPFLEFSYCRVASGRGTAERTRAMAVGDEVITTPLEFVSTNHAILYERLRPVFADVDGFLCLDPQSAQERITERMRAVSIHDHPPNG